MLLTMDDVYGTFVKQSPTPLMMLDNKMRIMAQSDRWRQLWKSRPTEDDYLSPLRTAYPALPERWFRELEGCIKSGTLSAGEEHIELIPGDQRCLLWEINRWQISKGASGIFLTVHDETEKRQAQENALVSEQKYQYIHRQTPAMMHSIDANTLIVEVSDQWLKKLGYDRDQVIGRHLKDFLTPSSTEYASNVVLPAFFQTGRCDNIAYQFVHRNGDILGLLLSAHVERDDDGNVTRSITVLTDVRDLHTPDVRQDETSDNAHE